MAYKIDGPAARLHCTTKQMSAADIWYVWYSYEAEQAAGAADLIEYRIGDKTYVGQGVTPDETIPSVAWKDKKIVGQFRDDQWPMFTPNRRPSQLPESH